MAVSNPMFIVAANQLVNVSMIQQIMIDSSTKTIKIVLTSPPTIININYVNEEVMYDEYKSLRSVLYTPVVITSGDLTDWEDKIAKQIKEKQAEQEKEDMLKNAGLFK